MMTSNVNTYVTAELVPEISYLRGQRDERLLALQKDDVPLDQIEDDAVVIEILADLAILERRLDLLKHLARAHAMKAKGHVPDSFLDEVFVTA